MADRKYLVKISPDTDAYVYWSTERDAPMFGGTREEVTKFLTDTAEHPELIADRFERADATGTSARPYTDQGGARRPGFFAWDEPGDFVAEQRGLVARGDLMELWRCSAVNKPYGHILKPFADGHRVGWADEEVSR